LTCTARRPRQRHVLVMSQLCLLTYDMLRGLLGWACGVVERTYYLLYCKYLY
jgi:hypothetical protein